MFRKVKQTRRNVRSADCFFRVVAVKNEALRQSTPDEFLYGRAGYLYTLMYLRKQFGVNAIETQLITEVI